jgi:hypothetical protein
MAAEQQNFAGGALATTLASPINASATSMTVGATTGWPVSGLPFTLTIDQGNATLQETVFVRSYTGTTVTLDSTKGRGYDGTTAQSHLASAPVLHTPDAAWFADISARAFAVSTLGDIPYVSNTTGVAMGRVGIGSTYYGLGVVGGVPAWQPTTRSVSTTTGDIVYASAPNAITRLGVGSTNQVLTIVGGVPAWATSTSLALTYVESFIGTDVSVASTTADITSVSLAAGTWLIQAQATVNYPANAGSSLEMWLGPTSASVTGAYGGASFYSGVTTTQSTYYNGSIRKMVVLGSTTTIYLTGYSQSVTSIFKAATLQQHIPNATGITAVKIA